MISYSESYGLQYFIVEHYKHTNENINTVSLLTSRHIQQRRHYHHKNAIISLFLGGSKRERRKREKEKNPFSYHHLISFGLLLPDSH